MALGSFSDWYTLSLSDRYHFWSQGRSVCERGEAGILLLPYMEERVSWGIFLLDEFICLLLLYQAITKV